MYHLLPDQVVSPIATADKPIMSFNDAEQLIQDSELTEDETLDKELKFEVSIPRWFPDKIKQFSDCNIDVTLRKFASWKTRWDNGMCWLTV